MRVTGNVYQGIGATDDVVNQRISRVRVFLPESFAAQTLAPVARLVPLPGGEGLSLHLKT